MYDIENETSLIESNNFELFSSAENNYIKGTLIFSIDASGGNLKFIKISVPCSRYIDIYDEISMDEYKKLTKSVTLLSLVEHFSVSLQQGWIASDWIYSPDGKSSSCILSRSELPLDDKKDKVLIKIEDIVTFGLEDNTSICFEFYKEEINKKTAILETICADSQTIIIPKTFDSLGQNTLKSTRYTLSETDKATLLWTERDNGTSSSEKEEIQEFHTTASFKHFIKGGAPCTISYMPPQVAPIVIPESGKEVSWITAFCTSSYIRFDNGSFENVTNNNKYDIDWNKQSFVHLRFTGYLYQIDKVVYNTKNCDINSVVDSLKQTVYYFKDSCIRLMQLEWTRKKDFHFLVKGTPLCHDYIINGSDRTSFEFPFQTAGEDYTAIFCVVTSSKNYELLL